MFPENSSDYTCCHPRIAALMDIAHAKGVVILTGLQPIHGDSMTAVDRESGTRDCTDGLFVGERFESNLEDQVRRGEES